MRTTLEVPTIELKAGDVIADRYRVIDVLGRGAFGAVYGAVHVTTKQPVAIKLLLGDGSGPKEKADTHVRRFYREAQVTANLRHANTVRVFDVGQTENGAFFIAMERLDGITLEKLLIDREAAGTVLTQGETIDIAVAILGSLAEAHEKGLVHRDLKPGNIMLTQVAGDPVVKVLDFGIVRAQGSGLTQDGRAVGTPGFMSPEQCMGKPLDGRSDIYALAAMMFVCVTGRLVFNPDTPLQMMMMHVQALPPDVRQHATTLLDDSFASLVMKNLAKEPTDRSKDARELRKQLSRIRGSVPGLVTDAYLKVPEPGAAFGSSSVNAPTASDAPFAENGPSRADMADAIETTPVVPRKLRPYSQPTHEAPDFAPPAKPATVHVPALAQPHSKAAKTPPSVTSSIDPPTGGAQAPARGAERPRRKPLIAALLAASVLGLGAASALFFAGGDDAGGAEKAKGASLGPKAVPTVSSNTKPAAASENVGSATAADAGNTQTDDHPDSGGVESRGQPDGASQDGGPTGDEGTDASAAATAKPSPIPAPKPAAAAKPTRPGAVKRKPPVRKRPVVAKPRKAKPKPKPKPRKRRKPADDAPYLPD